jgi:uncharacterized membrane protein
MAKTVVGLMDTYQEAESVIRDLVDSGFKGDEIGFLGREDIAGRVGPRDEKIGTEPRTVEKAAAGATLGGVTGLVIGLAIVAIPGIGPVAAAGPVGTALAGGGIGFAAGGIIGALTGAGVPEEEAQYYAEGVRRGGALVILRTEDRRADQAVDIMERHGAVDIARRAEQWRQAGWARFDEQAEPYTSKIVRERGAGRPGMEEDYRRHFRGVYPEGEDFDSYRSAYAFGAELAEANRYRGRLWPQIESEVKEEWECYNPGPWDKYKEAIHYGWERRAKVHEEA